MSITDELRNYANHRIDVTRDPLLAIADSIDAEHKKACDDAWNNGYEADYLGIENWLIEHPQVMEHHGFVRLPKDANGEYISVGDVMDKGKVTCIRDCGKGWEVVLNDLYTYDASSLHHHAQTVEDVLEEFAHAILNQKADYRKQNIAEYAAKLRLKEDA
jgi:hypothetical protein